MANSDRERNRQNWRAVAEWATSPRMNDLEALMWRAESHPELSSVVVALEVLDRAPPWPRLRKAHEWGSELVPRFRQRVVEPAVPVGPPAWEPDPAFDLDYHLRRVVLPAPGTHRELLELAQAFAQSPLDRGRPLWEALLVEGLAEGRAAYVLKTHPSIADGIAGIHLFAGIRSRTRKPSVRRPRPEPAAEGPPGSGVGLALDDLADTIRALPGAARRLAPALGRMAVHPRASAAAGQRLLASARRVATVPATPSDLLGLRAGRVWRFRTLDVPLVALKAAGAAGGGSVNDAYLAGLLGGLARYHDAMGAPITDLPVAVPVSLRRPDDPHGGNRFTAVQIAGPASIAGPLERIAAIRAQILSARVEPALGLIGLAAPVLSRLPADLAHAARGRMGLQADLSASNFPGLHEDVYIAGARVERFYAFGPLPGTAVMATLVSHQGTCCITLNCDGEAIADPDLLTRCMEAAFDEVVAAT